MPELANRQFLDLSEDRKFPLDEMATGTSNQGTELPPTILADMRLTLDPVLGQSVFVSSVSVGTELASVTLMATDELQFKSDSVSQEVYGSANYQDPGNNDYFNEKGGKSFIKDTTPSFPKIAGSGISGSTPIAVATVTLDEARKGLPVRIEALTEGADGWVVFGRELDTYVDKVWSFNGVDQSAVSRRSIHFLNFNRVKTIGKSGGSTPSHGIVNIVGDNGIAVTRSFEPLCFEDEDCTEDCSDGIHCYDLDNYDPALNTREVITIGFSGDRLEENLKKYTGPCGNRPDTGTCPRGTPILSINGVPPVKATGGIYDNVIFLIFPRKILPYVFGWHEAMDTETGGVGGDYDTGIVLESVNVPIKDVCPPQLPGVGEDGDIGADGCCEDCTEDCVDITGEPGAVRSLYEEISMGSRGAHICLGTGTLTIHEYNETQDTVSRTHLLFIGSLHDSYVYAQDTNDLSSGLVAYINISKGLFHLNEDGAHLSGLIGRVGMDTCRSGTIPYVDGNSNTQILTAAPQSIFTTVASALHTPVVDLDYVLEAGTEDNLPLVSSYYCEQEYGVYNSVNNYRLEVTPYADPLTTGSGKYPFTLYKVDSAAQSKLPIVSGNLEATSVAGDNNDGSAKPTPRLDSGPLNITYKGSNFTGSIYSDLASLGSCT